MMDNSAESNSSHQIVVPISYGDCRICKDLWRGFAGVDRVQRIKLGSFQEALASSCPGHTPLVQVFQDHFRNLDAEWRGSEPNDMGILISPGGDVQITQSVEKLGICWDLLLVNRNVDADTPSFGSGRILDLNWADLEMVREWKKCCLESHGAACENPMKIWRTRPAWLVDVERNCIVPGNDCPRFVALSYTWGSKPPFVPVDLDMIERLQSPGSLEDPDISALLAPMVQHAIRLTCLIGESYLWVDALCISQGTYEETSKELLRMGAIYANAVVTIIAADGDSQDGLRGLKGVSGSRDLEQRIIPFGDEKIVVRNTGVFSMVGGTRYYERGWTYQELKMSPRKLLFNEKELHWECQCKLWHEELTLGSEAHPYIDPRSRKILAGFPDMGALDYIISCYNRLELTYDEDALSGILGMLTIFSRSFVGGFLYGMPEMMFDRCLGWQPFWGNTDLKRRVHSGRANASSLSPSELPSWSWIGWQGMVKLGSEAARYNPREHVIEETTSITTWYTSSSSDATSPQRKIRPTWFDDRITGKDFSRPLPAGWTRHSASSAEKFRDEPHLFPDGCGDFLFRHCNMEDGDESSWYYPFPVADIQESTPPFMPEQTQYLFCETKKGHLWGQRVPMSSETNEVLEQNIVALFSESGTRVGRLHLHSEEDLDTFPDHVTDDGPGRGIDLIAIYKFRRYSKTWNEAQQRYEGPIEVKDFYQVLWVQWKGRIAYRLASGSVETGDWESLDLEDISLVLG